MLQCLKGIFSCLLHIALQMHMWSYFRVRLVSKFIGMHILLCVITSTQATHELLKERY